MAITVVGSVAYDTIETPQESGALPGGAATYFRWLPVSLPRCASSQLWRDFAGAGAVFQRGASTRGIERRRQELLLEGSYLDNLNEAKTHTTDLNVFAAFEPKIPEAYRDSEFLFLANIDPVLQRRVREQMPGVKLVAGDTMNY